MPRIIGIFDHQRAVEEVIEQLALNGIDRTTTLDASGHTGEGRSICRELHALRLPEKQATEYQARLQRHQCLLLVEASALELPTVQRILRNGHVVDIDLLPDTSP